MKADHPILTIFELTRKIRSLLEKAVGSVWVEGEISNLHYHPSGHVYFTLKDEQAQLSAVMFRGDAARLRFKLKDGMLIQGHGRITVYEKRGNYQIVLDMVQLAGAGSLQAAFEALKKKLQAEGLFDADRKKSLPIFPKTVGVVTAPNGAAIRDFCRVLHRRFPGVRIIIAPTRVQGDGAAQEIAAAIDLLNLAEAGGLEVRIDVIAIIRGGGSLEDLWAFNEEVVARAVARSKIPTISGVGHEVDFTICDFVADARAATPSMAAEMVIRPRHEFAGEILGLFRQLQRSSLLALGEWKHQLLEMREVLRRREPRQFIREARQRLDDAMSGLFREMNRWMNQGRQRWVQAAQKFLAASPRSVIERKRYELNGIQNRLQQKPVDLLKTLQHRLELGKERLMLLSPVGTLARGYSITMDAETKRVIRSTRSLKSGRKVITKLGDGEFKSVVESD